MSFHWLDEKFVIAVHEAQLVEHGGLPGIRDAGLLTSALARAEHLAAYGSPTVYDCAAAYGYGICRNHPFIDGNKRTGLVASAVFLMLNRQRLMASNAAAAVMMLAVAAGDIEEAAFSAWLRDNSVYFSPDADSEISEISQVS